MSTPASSTTPTAATAAAAVVVGAAGVTTDDQTNAEARRKAGEFVRGMSTARNWVEAVTADNPNPRYPVAKDRYHLYVGYNCPWCHRVVLARALQGLEDVVTVDVLFPNRSSEGEPRGPNLWKFCPEGQVGMNGKHVQFPSCTVDTVGGKAYAKEIYEAAGIDDQKSVPILYDKLTKTVVNNESAEIVRMFGTVFRSVATRADTVHLYPAEHAAAIDTVNDWVYKEIANGSYKAGFSSNQDTYETAYHTYFAALDRLNQILKDQPFVAGPVVTEADVRLFPPLFRHDPVYHARFKLNQAYLWEYPYIWQWMGRMMALPGMEPVSNAEYLQHCKQGYFGRTGNGTVPVGPAGYPECYTKPHASHAKVE